MKDAPTLPLPTSLSLTVEEGSLDGAWLEDYLDVNVSYLDKVYLKHQGSGFLPPLSLALELLAECAGRSSKLSHRRAVPRTRLEGRCAGVEH